MATDKNLLVIHPNVPMTAKTIRGLESAGFIVVRGLPESFTVISAKPQPGDAVVLAAALEAIGQFSPTDISIGNQMRSKFARALVTKLGYGGAVMMK